MSETVGFVGLGRMGVPMARCLIEAGFRLRGYDVEPAARDRYARETGASPAASLEDAAAGAGFVVTMLPDSAAVERALLEDGLLDALGTDAVVIDMSSSEPTSTVRLAETIAATGRQLVDAPVSGGVRGAEAGSLTIMVGGSPEQVAACRPLLEAMGEEIVHVGSAGAGHALKSLNNVLVGTTLLASAEALVAGERFGLDPRLLLDVINRSTGRSWSTEFKLPKYVLPRSFDSGFDLGLLVKDMRIATGFAQAADAPLSLGEAALALWEQAREALPADADHTEIARWVEQRADTRSAS